jgi:hypothetical protein
LQLELSSFGTVNDYEMAVSIRFPAGARHFLSAPYRLELTQPPIQCVLDAVSSGIKWQGHEADNIPPSSAEIEDYGAITTFPYVSILSWVIN